MRIALLIMFLIMATTTQGCRQKVKERKYYAQSGTAKRIDADTGIVAMDWHNHKTNETTSLTGRLTPETEIFINGVSAGAQDVRLGDRVEVIVYESPEYPGKYIVTRVAVEREESYLLSTPPSGSHANP
jgi:hypothetical protein